jgi:hypothetical protein
MLRLASEVAVERLLSGLRDYDIRASAYGRARIRFVIHSGIARSDVSVAADCIATVFGGRVRAGRP